MKRILESLLSVAAVLTLVGCGPECPTGGTGTVVVTYTGLPSGVTGTTTFTGPGDHTVTSPQTLSRVTGGRYAVAAQNAADADTRVRTAYAGTPTPASFCLANGATANVEIRWAPIASSNRLWATNGNGSAELIGFGASRIRSSGTPAADASVQGPAGKDLTFDRDGNLWTLGATTADAQVNRFAAADLGASGRKTPDRKINVAGLSCLPALYGMAFDSHGNLWVSSACANAVYRLDASAIAASATVTPGLTLVVTDATGLAFDSAGNLWVGEVSSTRVLRFDAAGLSGSTPSAPALKLGARATDLTVDTSLLNPSWLAFDKNGDLWANDFGANTFFRIPKAELARTGTQDTVPAVRITVGVTALIEGFAFDEEGGLWTALSQGRIGRLSPGQLLTSSGPGTPTAPELVITSADTGSAGNIALYPAPAALPLYHRLP